jgi:hypothetical protein
MDDEREPDLTEDARKIDEGDGGYPEENPAGGSGGQDRGKQGGESAPDTEGGQDESPSGATGNPDAAGG